tara:strand:+ start:178 stop:423 length:246 start_codon:yes stop_codon:yes gene_type:complete
MNRTKLERQDEVRTIIRKLTELHLTTIYSPIVELMTLLKKYIQEEVDIKIKIPFYEIKKTIVGYLPINKNKPCWVKLTNEN